MKIDLQLNNGFSWENDSIVWAKGYLYCSENKLHEGESLLEYFNDVKTKKDFENKLKRANGFFCVILKQHHKVFAAVDHVRSHPLFYDKKNQWIGDHPNSFDGVLKKNKLSEKEFKSALFVTGKDTCYKDIFQIQAGHYLIIDEKIVLSNPYYKYLHSDFYNYSNQKYLNNLNKVVDQSIERLINFARGNQIVIPLSGGRDSRLIALKIKAFGYKNVVCFSYGEPNNSESLVSQAVAKHLGFNWIFINYNECINSKYNQSKNINEYIKYSHRGVSLSHVQDFFAVEYLKKKDLVDEKAIFVAGHSGDFLAGSQLSKELLSGNGGVEAVALEAIKKRYVNFKLNKKEKIILSEKIKQSLPNVPPEFDSSTLYEYWFLQEHIAKFCVNSMRVYEYFGYRWVLPLWDLELTEFFRKIEIKHRYKNVLYNRFVDQLDVELAKRKPANKKNIYIYKIYIFAGRIVQKILNNIGILIKLRLQMSTNLMKLYKIISLFELIEYVSKGYRSTNGLLIGAFENAYNLIGRKNNGQQ